MTSQVFLMMAISLVAPHLEWRFARKVSILCIAAALFFWLLPEMLKG